MSEKNIEAKVICHACKNPLLVMKFDLKNLDFDQKFSFFPPNNFALLFKDPEKGESNLSLIGNQWKCACGAIVGEKVIQDYEDPNAPTNKFDEGNTSIDIKGIKKNLKLKTIQYKFLMLLIKTKSTNDLQSLLDDYNSKRGHGVSGIMNLNPPDPRVDGFRKHNLSGLARALDCEISAADARSTIKKYLWYDGKDYPCLSILRGAKNLKYKSEKTGSKKAQYQKSHVPKESVSATGLDLESILMEPSSKVEKEQQSGFKSNGNSSFRGRGGYRGRGRGGFSGYSETSGNSDWRNRKIGGFSGKNKDSSGFSEFSTSSRNGGSTISSFFDSASNSEAKNRSFSDFSTSSGNPGPKNRSFSGNSDSQNKDLDPDSKISKFSRTSDSYSNSDSQNKKFSGLPYSNNRLFSGNPVSRNRGFTNNEKKEKHFATLEKLLKFILLLIEESNPERALLKLGEEYLDEFKTFISQGDVSELSILQIVSILTNPAFTNFSNSEEKQRFRNLIKEVINYPKTSNSLFIVFHLKNFINNYPTLTIPVMKDINAMFRVISQRYWVADNFFPIDELLKRAGESQDNLLLLEEIVETRDSIKTNNQILPNGSNPGLENNMLIEGQHHTVEEEKDKVSQIEVFPTPSDFADKELDDQETKNLELDFDEEEEVNRATKLFQNTKNFVPKNIKEGPFKNFGQYRRIHFLLNRADYMAPLKEGILELEDSILKMKEIDEMKQLGQRVPKINLPRFTTLPIYCDMTIQAIIEKKEVTKPDDVKKTFKIKPAFLVRFSTPKRNAMSKSSQLLKFGSLLILFEQEHGPFRRVLGQKDLEYILASAKSPTKTPILCTISDRENVDRGEIQVEFCREEDLSNYQEGTFYFAIESPVYFSSVEPVLKYLKRMNHSDVPFLQEILCHKMSKNETPEYLKKKTGLDLSPVIKPRVTQEEIDVQDRDLFLRIAQGRILEAKKKINFQSEWIADENTILDPSQSKALRHVLNNKISLIVGPPGTGKSFLGIRILKILMKNFTREELGPIVCVCYTNHALDQVLDHASHFCKDFVRLGSRSKSDNDLIQKNNLTTMRLKMERSWQQRKTLHELYDKRTQLLQQNESIISADPLDAILTFPEFSDEIITWTNLLRMRISDKFGNEYVHTTSNPKIGFINWILGKDFDATDGINKKLDIEEFQRIKNKNPYGDLYKKRDREDDSSDEEAVEDADEIEDAEEIEYIDGIDLEITTLNTADPHRGLQVPKNDDTVQKKQVPKKNDLDTEENEENAQSIEELLQMAENQKEEDEKRQLIADDNIDDGRDEVGLKDIASSPQLHLNYRLQAAVDSKIITDDLHQWMDSVKNTVSIRKNSFWGVPMQQRIEIRHELFKIFDKAKEFCLKQILLEVRRAEADIKNENKNEDYQILKRSSLIGMTSTRAAADSDLINRIQPKVMIVEEAGELLEGQLIASLPASIQHLIMIGDQRQLRPKVNSYTLEVRHNYAISLFERLIMNGFPCSYLQVQQRMHPKISRLVKPFYQTDVQLLDHDKVKEFPDKIIGMQDNVVFMNHTHSEAMNPNLKSKNNQFEAEMSVLLAIYLINCGYNARQITILTAYKAQQFLIMKILMEQEELRMGRNKKIAKQEKEENEKNEKNVVKKPRDDPIVITVDDYQGEENEIMILSLVRNNNINSLGFVKIQNRIIVSLSRARKALFIFGNAKLLKNNSKDWFGVISQLEETNSVKEYLPICCPNHPSDLVSVDNPDQFLQYIHGGCTKICGHRLDCGHICEHACHAIDHKKMRCLKSCEKTLECGHVCPRKCHYPQKCICETKVTLQLPCGHMHTKKCHVERIECTEMCGVVLPCGHICKRSCYLCTAAGGHDDRCKFKFPAACATCGNANAFFYCHDNTKSIICEKRCQSVLPCGHPCPGKCSECVKSGQHLKCTHLCTRTMICGHECRRHACSEMCPPCVKQTPIRCKHGTYKNKCCESSMFCQEKCGRKCDCPKSQQCSKLCFAKCDVPPCEKPCPKRILSSICLLRQKPRKNKRKARYHDCRGLCGERCPNICIECDARQPEAQQWKCPLSMTTSGELLKTDDKIYTLSCGHTFVVDSLDQYFNDPSNKGQNDGIAVISYWKCPCCKNILFDENRYQQKIKDAIQEVEVLKRFLLKKQAAQELRGAINSIFTAMGTVSGHWYFCPNKHPYYVGDCGGPMQVAKCPECGVAIGGSGHVNVTTDITPVSNPEQVLDGLLSEDSDEEEL